MIAKKKEFYAEEAESTVFTEKTSRFPSA